MPISEEMQAIIDQLGPGIQDGKAAGCASLLLQEAGTEANYTSRSRRSRALVQTRLSLDDKCCFDDTDYLNQLGPRVDDENLSEYMHYVLS